MNARKSHIKWAVIVLVCVLASASFGVGTFLYLHGLQEDELRQNLITSCEQNGNPLREVLQKRIEREIEQAENRDLFEKLFPKLAGNELEKLIATNIKELHREEKEIKPINCEKQYSK